MDDLRKSRWRGSLKSCPQCSSKAGKLVFHSTEKYGQRTSKGRVVIQSWCMDCRAKRGK